MNRKAYDWNEKYGDDNGDNQPEYRTSKGLAEKDRSDLQWCQEEPLQSTDSFLKGDHDGCHGCG